jgi:DNA processing protein
MSDCSPQDVEQAVAALALLTSKRAGASTVRDLLLATKGQVHDAASFLEAAGVPPGGLNASLSLARGVIEKGIDQDVWPIPASSDNYPATLLGIADAPPVIYFRGSLAALMRGPGVAVVGTRKATIHGITIAERLSEFLSNAGYSVVSGLALGIDAAAHEGALRTGTPTIAVLAHGLEKASPRANAPLAARILEQGGAWLSEHPVGTPAKPEYFVQRNRIQVGLSLASIIVEGEERSGSATQAEYCLRNRRALFAVLPRPSDAVATQHRLPQMLVAQRGAIAIRSRDDYQAVLDVLARRQTLSSRGAEA